MEWTTATAQALAVKTCRGKYGWPEYNTGDGIALRPDCKVVSTAFVVVCGFADQMNHKGQGVLGA